MSRLRPFLFLCLLAGAPAAASAAQEVPDTGASQPAATPQLPSELMAVEEARSRRCVGVFATLTDLESSLEPIYRRGQRINELGQAMRLEDTTGVAPFDADDALEQRVADWFESDLELGRRWAESGDSTILAQRRRVREALLDELRDSIRALNARGQEMVAGTGDVEQAAAGCQGKILVRPVVLEVCDTVSSPVCEPARPATPDGNFRFVERAADLWDVEQLQPWSEPSPLARGPEGSLVGARTAGSVRRGNLRVMAGVGHILRARSDLSQEQIAEFEANLEGLGIPFDHPALVMAPALDVLVDVPAPLAGESHYFLHFGDLSDPQNQVVWTVAAGGGGPIQASMPAAPQVLARLQAGEALSLTAVRIGSAEADEVAAAEEVTEAEALYTISLTPVSQAPTVSRLLQYMTEGGFNRDLLRLVPPPAGG